VSQRKEHDDLAALIREHQLRTELLVATYAASSRRDRRASLLAEYRCRRRCELLVVWQAPGPVRLALLPGYKLSAERNEAESVPSARARRTSDGDRHWNRRVLILDELDGCQGVAIDLNCDHYRTHISVDSLLSDLQGVRPGKPLQRVMPG